MEKITTETSKEKLEEQFFYCINRYFSSFEEQGSIRLAGAIDRDSYDTAIVYHNELVRRSNEDFIKESRITSRKTIKLTRWSIGLAVVTILTALVSVLSSISDNISDKEWRDGQLYYLEKIQKNTKGLEKIIMERDSLKNELWKATMLIEIYEEEIYDK